MKEQSYTCDRCGRPAYAFVRMSVHEIVPPMRCEPHDFYELDLCDECLREVLAPLDVRKEDK